MSGERAVGSQRACRLAGITYRQLHFWATRGLIVPVGSANRNGTGSGIPWRWTYGEVVVAARMGVLMEAGMSLSVAAEMARSGNRCYRLSRNVEVVVVVETKDCNVCMGTGHIIEIDGQQPRPFDVETEQQPAMGEGEVWVCPNCFWREQ
jgi:hypothetical protein